ncbi:MAG: helix-turn-helix transcriptional regulator [Candidatus Aminicenantes bacterium]|nr:helix-turn-helix transcriptional regulator [Candidatus Aminicenantes bacterium]
MKELREFQKSLDLNQRQMARLLGISEPNLSEILAGRKTPSKKLARKISQKTGISILKLLFPLGGQDEARN